MSKLQRLRDNIAALEEALSEKKHYDWQVLSLYSGFGGMNFLLNTGDKSTWSKSDQVYYEDTARLRQMLVKAAGSGNKYDAWLQSLKSSVLTAYYTPDVFVGKVMGAINKHAATRTILDPAAGARGQFFKAASVNAMAKFGIGQRCVAYEKDLLSGLVLSRLSQTAYEDVRVKGFETIPDSELGRFDLVATNVPFGNVAVFDAAYTKSDNAVRRDAAKMIHKYYVLKGLDCLRDGGIEAYIITSNYLNRDGEQLAEALKQSRLIGAYRLANNLFKESGTEVGTDLLVLQKDVNKQGLTADESMLLTQYEDEGCPTNLYFQCYQDHVIATSTERDTDAYGKPGFVYMHRDGVSGISKQMGEVLAKDMTQNFDAKLFEDGCGTATHTKGKQEKTYEEKVADYQERFRKTAHGKLLKEIYECYTKLYEYEAKEMTENAELRKELNRLYDKCAAAYGMINPMAVTASGRYKVEAISKDLLGLERWDDEQGRWTKADIFQKPIAFSTDELHEAGTPQEALAQSLNDYGRPDMPYMMAMTGMTEEELLDALDGEVFFDPIEEDYKIKAKFICGNVIEKLEQIRKKYPEAGRHVARAIKALEDAVPEPIPFEDLDFNLGERWLDPYVYGKFASEFFDVPEDKRPSWSKDPLVVTVKYNGLLDQYAADASYNWNEKLRTQYHVTSEASQDLYGLDLLVHALQNTCPKMMRYQRNANGGRITNAKGDYLKEEDPDKTQIANTKVEEIRQGYVDWLQRQPKEFKEHLADVYNRRFNCFVKPKYDGSHQTFPGIDMKGLEQKYGIKSIYDSQKDCVWMLLLNGGGICDHEVGSGKTLIMCIAAHEMKRLGMCHKPMIIGLKANVSAIAETYRTAYPQAKILFAREKDYSGSERVAFFNQMKNNDWDCVIMSHDQFGRIPQSQDIQLAIMQDEMQQIEDALTALNGWGYSLSSRVRRGLEVRKRNMGVKIQALQHDIESGKDDVVDFHMMGIDHIFVDESHQFKNLGFSTRHDRVAGLGNNEGSKRAYNLLMAIRTIQQKTGRDLGATFLSGTTVTNSLTELYLLFRYLRPQALARQGITCFDAWAAIFTKKSQEFEFGVTNQIVMKERFRYFIKVPELAMFYNDITDFRTAEDVGIDRPKKHVQLLSIDPTPDQEAFIETLMKFAKTGDFKLIGILNPTDKQQKAKMLYATDLARKMSLDMRMIDPSYPDHPRSKASKCAWLVNEYYHKFDAVKGTQLIFSDLSTWQGANKGFNVYEDIKNKLVAMGIPEKEIRFIQECKCDSKKQQLIDDVNKGKVRVLFGSTSMLGTGVNAQKRVVAVHHLDTPWRPSDLEQRDGRAIRKGNEIAKEFNGNQVEVIIYAVKRSLDSYKFNLLHCKQTFINQLKRGQLSIRTLDEGSFDENTGMNFSEYMAILSGNTDLLERAKLEKKIAALEGERKNFLRDQREQEQRMESLRQENERMAHNINIAQADYDQFLERKRPDENGFVINDLTIDGFTVPDGMAVGSDDWKKAVGERLLQIDRTADTSGAHVAIGSICGFFRVLVRTVKTYLDIDGQMKHENVFSVDGNGLLKHTFNGGYLNRTSARISADNPLQALMAIPGRIEEWQRRSEDNAARIEQLKSITGQSWPKENELKKLRADLGILDRKINAEINKDKQSGSNSNEKPGETGLKQAA